MGVTSNTESLRCFKSRMDTARVQPTSVNLSAAQIMSSWRSIQIALTRLPSKPKKSERQTPAEDPTTGGLCKRLTRRVDRDDSFSRLFAKVKSAATDLFITPMIADSPRALTEELRT